MASTRTDDELVAEMRAAAQNVGTCLDWYDRGSGGDEAWREIGRMPGKVQAAHEALSSSWRAAHPEVAALIADFARAPEHYWHRLDEALEALG